MSQLEAAESGSVYRSAAGTMSKKAEVAWVSLFIFSRTSHLSDGPDIVQVCTRPCSPSLVHLCASYLPVSPLKNTNPLYCAPSLTSSPILLSIALSSRPVFKPLAPAASHCALRSRAQCPPLQPFVTLFLDGTTHLKAPRPFPVQTRSVRTREAVC